MTVALVRRQSIRLMLHDIAASLKRVCHVRECGSIENTCGYSGTNENIGSNMALEQCRKGNYTAGISELRQILQKNGITVPPSQAATAK